MEILKEAIENNVLYEDLIIKDVKFPEFAVINNSEFRYCIFDGCNFEWVTLEGCDINAVFVNCEGSIVLEDCEGKILHDGTIETVEIGTGVEVLQQPPYPWEDLPGGLLPEDFIY